ncbi:hypothetical protein SDC9_30576 [bioreactor metagenome]|uniref:Uncharacterized protein n=1 Tax=bioreactor metagenome TaxID=1076179 RepID=A0A644V0A8_9ZZZZ
MRRPVRIGRNLAPGARVHRAKRQGLHADAIDRADIDAEVAGDAFLVLHGEGAVLAHGDRLVRGVLAGGIAAPALDAILLVDHRLGDMVQVQVLPFREVRHRAPDDLLDRSEALPVHVVRQARDHLLHHLEAIGHRRGTNLHVARPHRQELGRVAPGGDAADARDRQAAGLGVTRDLAHHVQRDRLHRRAAIAAMGALAVDHRLGAEVVEIDRGHRFDRVDQADRVRPAALGGQRRRQDRSDIGRQLHDAGHARILLHPAGHHLDVFGHLPHRRAHAALGHAMRAAEVQLDAVGAGVLDMAEDRLPALLVAGHHQRHHERPVGIVALDRLDLAQVDLERAVGDQLDVVDPHHPPVAAIDHAIARPRDVDDGRPLGAEGLPHHAAPARLIGTADVVFLVGRRRRGEPERVRRLDADESAAQVRHLSGPHQERVDVFGRIAPLRDGIHRQVLARGGAVAARPDPRKARAPRPVSADLRPRGLHPLGQRAKRLADRREHLIRLQPEGVVEHPQPGTAGLGARELDLEPARDGMDRHRRGVADDPHAMRRGMLLLVHRGRHLGLRAAIDDGRGLGTQQLRLHRRVDRGHAAADHHHLAPDRQGGKVVGLPQRRDELGRRRRKLAPRHVQRVHPGQPDAEEDGVVPAEQIRERAVARTAKRPVRHHLDAADLQEPGDLARGEIVGRLVGGDAVFIEPAELRLRLVEHHLVALEREPVRTGKPRGPAAHHRDRAPGGRAGSEGMALLLKQRIGGKALQQADLDRLALGLHPHAGALAQVLGRADAGAHAAEDVLREDRLRRRLGRAGRDLPDEEWNVDRRRAGRGAGRVMAEIAPIRRHRGRMGGERRRDILEIRRIALGRKPPGRDTGRELAVGHLGPPWLCYCPHACTGENFIKW